MWHTTESRADLDRPGVETEFAYGNNQPPVAVRVGMKVQVHFCFRVWLFYCGRLESFTGVSSFVSEFNLARTALELTMPTIFARTMPFKKKISMGMD